MKKRKQYQFWVCFALGLALFVGTFPFYHDMYIAGVHTVICICLNAFSSVLFGAFFYCKWINWLHAEEKKIFLFFTVLQAIGHGVFAIMNWGSFFFLALTAVVLLLLAVSFFKE